MAESKYITYAGLLDHFRDLDQRGKVIAEYIWIDSSQSVRSKCKTLPEKPKSIKDLPEWNFDGSSTGQAEGNNSDVFLRPRAMYPDPFRRGDNILVIADTYMSDGSPNAYNTRHDAAIIMEAHKAEEFWFGLEQEFTMQAADGWPYGWPTGAFPAPQGPYYCGNGTGKAFGRDVVEAHYKCCLYAGLQISGTNAEVMPGQWEYQIGPVEGISLGDQLWVSRWLLQRVAEQFGIKITFHPKPIPGDWNGAGLHTNVSSKKMREDGGFQAIKDAMGPLEKRHKEHMSIYGEGNEQRMTGQHETASYDSFSWGVANRGSSVRINRECEQKGKGYFEDRRPASNGDPYLLTGVIVETLCGKVEGADMVKASKKAEFNQMEMPVTLNKP